MKKNSFMRRAVCLTGSAVLLTGMLALSANAQSYRVDADALNIRSGPGLSYPITGSLPEGALVEILDRNQEWGRIPDGWVNTRFLRSDSSAYPQFTNASGYVNTALLNVRQGPGTQYAVCGQVTEGYQLTILEIRDGWGRISDGWVSLRYVGKLSTPSGTPNIGGVTTNDSVIVTASTLNIRQGPGTNYQKVGSLSRGAAVKILEVRSGWGRIHDGWISLNYVRPGSGSYIQPDNHVYGDVAEITADSLNVRQGPGENYTPCGMMTKGFRTTVQEIRDGWGRVNGGWIDLHYVRWVK